MFDRLFGKKSTTKTPKTQTTKAKTKKSLKQVATENGEPYIEVIGLDIDAKNPVQGAFELEWNDVFVDELKKAGFRGPSDEEIVDQWFQQVCRNVALSQWETFDEDARVNSFVEKNDLGNGRTEVK
jgi:hypothetical protein